MGWVKIRLPFSTLALPALSRDYGVELVPENGERGSGARWAQPRSKRLCCASQCAVHHSRAMGHLLCLGV